MKLGDTASGVPWDNLNISGGFLFIGDTMTTEDLTHLGTQRRRKIEACLRAIRQGGRSLALLASAAEICIHESDRDSAGELESVHRQIQALQAEADAIAREINASHSSHRRNK